MLSREGKQTDRGAVGAEFIGYNRRRREALLLQEFPHQPNCRPSVPAGLNQEIQDFALTVHGTPEIELPPSNYDDHLVQVPAFGRSWPPTLNPPRIGPTEFQDPSSNCLIRDVETTLGKQVLNVPIAQRETAIEPDGMLDDDRWKAVTTVGYLAHQETLKHRPCRSHAVNVTMPSRLLWLHFYTRQAMPVLMEGLESAFGRFGGVPEELLFDQMRAVVLSGGRGAGGGEEFLRFAAHWGSSRARADPTGPRPRAKWSARSATSARASSAAARLRMTTISTSRPCAGWRAQPTSAGMPRPGSVLPAASGATGGRCFSPWRTIPTGVRHAPEPAPRRLPATVKPGRRPLGVYAEALQ